MAEKKTTKAAAMAEDTVMAEVQATEKKAVEKKTTAKKTTTKKAASFEMHVQFSGKSYSQEELMKMAKDVWRYDLKQKVGELKSMELYVKPEESAVYYVMNEEFTGSFYI